MKKLRGWLARLGGLFNRRRKDRELDNEIESHLQLHTEDNLRSGMTPEEARRQAMIKLGGVETTKEAYRDQRGLPLTDVFFQDIRFGARQLGKNPGFAAVAVLTLALGIGANTAIFTLIDAVLLKKLPVKEPDRLVLLRAVAPREFSVGSYRGDSGEVMGRRSMTAFTYQSFKRMRDLSGELAEIFAFGGVGGAMNLVADGHADLVDCQAVSGNYFTALGVQPFLGRLLTDEDDKAAASAVAVLSHRYWQQHFGGNAAIIGKQISLNKAAFTVIGVTPPRFEGTMGVGTPLDVAIPIAREPEVVLKKEDSRMYGEGAWWLGLMGRLKPGTTAAQSRAQLENAFHQSIVENRAARATGETAIDTLAPNYPQLLLDPGAQGRMDARRSQAPALYLLQSVVGLVLLIVCANVASLLLSRAASRQKEVALRLALGASRWRIIRQLLTESVLLSSLGGALGVFLALWLKNGLLAMSDWSGDGAGELAPKLDWRALGFTTGLSLVTGICFGLVPACRSTKVDMGPTLKDSARGSSSASRLLLSRGLVVAQIALSLPLMIGAGLFVRTLLNIQRVEPGFNTSSLLLFSIQPELLGYSEGNLTRFYQRLAEHLEAVPGVRAVSFSDITLLAQMSRSCDVYLRSALDAAPDAEGRIKPNGGVHVNHVRENFLEMMGIPLLSGRALKAQDDAKAPRVAVVNHAFAKKYFPNENPIGKRFAFDPKKTDSVEIIGLAKDAKYTRQRDEIPPTAYLSWRQDLSGRLTFEVRTASDPSVMIPSIRQAVREVDDNLPLVAIKTQVQQADETLRTERLFAKLLTLCGGLAHLLASIGLFGVIAYAVSQRTREIGIRMALGATRRDVLAMIVRQGMTLAFIGIALGMAGAFASTQLIQSQLFGVGSSDPATFITVAALLIVVALLACWIPARRAARVDPMVALRSE